MITENNVLKILIKTDGFFDKFVDRLKQTFHDINNWNEETFDNVAFSAGWNSAFCETCKEFNLTEVEEFYIHLPWEDSDLFDGRVVDLIGIMCSPDPIKESKIKCYTPRWNNFQIRDVVYIDGHIDPDKFDVVRWYTHEPISCIDTTTGISSASKESCYTVATLEYFPVDNSFELHSCGMRFLNDYEDGLCEWILDWCNEYTKEHACEHF